MAWKSGELTIRSHPLILNKPFKWLHLNPECMKLSEPLYHFNNFHNVIVVFMDGLFRIYNGFATLRRVA